MKDIVLSIYIRILSRRDIKYCKKIYIISGGQVFCRLKRQKITSPIFRTRKRGLSKVSIVFGKQRQELLSSFVYWGVQRTLCVWYRGYHSWFEECHGFYFVKILRFDLSPKNMSEEATGSQRQSTMCMSQKTNDKSIVCTVYF